MAEPAGEEQRLAEAKKVVKQQAFYMKRALDQSELRDALKHASSMLGELRTSLLGPKAYYDLYISATDELRHMEAYISSEHKRGRRMLDVWSHRPNTGPTTLHRPAPCPPPADEAPCPIFPIFPSRCTLASQLYELVQHAGNVLPRLYLLLTVGAVYISSKEAAAKDIRRPRTWRTPTPCTSHAAHC